MVILNDEQNQLSSYIDAQPDIETKTSSTSVQATDLFSWGQEYDGGGVTSNHYPGQLDEVKIFDTALSTEEITAEYESVIQ